MIIKNVTLGQCVIIVKHIGISDKPMLTLVIEEKQLSGESQYVHPIGFKTTIVLNKIHYMVLKKIILENTLLKDTCTSNDFGVFRIQIIDKGEKATFFVPSRKDAIIYFNALIKKINQNNISSALSLNLERLLRRIR